MNTAFKEQPESELNRPTFCLQVYYEVDGTGVTGTLLHGSYTPTEQDMEVLPWAEGS